MQGTVHYDIVLIVVIIYHTSYKFLFPNKDNLFLDMKMLIIKFFQLSEI
jgi:hypothetical protein